MEDNLEKIFEGIKDNINICENFGGELRLGHSLIFYQILDKICERKQDEDNEGEDKNEIIHKIYVE